jgi:pimeloyl-ACP methyl ester carboxylesterase
MLRALLSSAVLLIAASHACGQSAPPITVHVNGVELHYIEQGQGEPVILLHGGIGDYSSWGPQMGPFSAHYRVISYSRRYSYPNVNPIVVPNDSALVDADDLAALIRKLKLRRVRLVGASAGAFAALALAIKHPELVHSLVLAEPPLHQWVRDQPGGEAVFQDFLTAIANPAADAFRNADTERAMRLFVDGMSGPGSFDKLAPERAAIVMRNAPAMKALLLSSDPFPNLSKDRARRLKIPTLVVTSERAIRIHRLVDEEIARVLPLAEAVTIPDAGHSSARDNPAAFNEAVLKFLQAH